MFQFIAGFIVGGWYVQHEQEIKADFDKYIKPVIKRFTDNSNKEE